MAIINQFGLKFQMDDNSKKITLSHPPILSYYV